jgi:hypothetical protein
MVPAGVITVTVLRTSPACHPCYSPESPSPYSSVLVSLPIVVAIPSLYPDPPLSARSQPPHSGSSWFHAFVGDFVSSSIPERWSYHFRSSSVPVSSTPLSTPTPLHRFVTVGRHSSCECGSRGLQISPVHNRFSPLRESAPTTRPVSSSGSKWPSTPFNSPPWSLVCRKKRKLKSRLLSSLSSSSPSSLSSSSTSSISSYAQDATDQFVELARSGSKSWD